jgi:hypothetical protein
MPAFYFPWVKNDADGFTPTLKVSRGSGKTYQWYSIKNIEWVGRKYPEIYFDGAIQQKDFTGFYFLPLYTHTEKFRGIPPDLKKTLQEKTCFHLKKRDSQGMKEVGQLLQTCFDL